MDIFAHALWTNAVFYSQYANQRRQRYMAVLFGVLPDLISFAPMVIYFVLSGIRFSETLFSNLAGAPWPIRYAAESYNYTHSFVIFLAVCAIVTLVLSLRRNGGSYKLRVYWPLLGWGLHIIIDIFTHPDFFRTPFLFPLSGYKNVHAISWAHPVFMAVNYGVLALIYILIFRWQKKRAK